MSDSTNPADNISVSDESLTVEKSFRADEFPVPAVNFQIESASDEPVRVRLTDEIPETFPMERIGFHPEFEGKNWTAYQNHTVEFERIIQPDEGPIRTVLGIRAEDPDIETFLTPPSIDQARIGEEIESVVGSDDSEAVREVIAGDRDSLLESGDVTGSDPDSSAMSGPDPDGTAPIDEAEETSSPASGSRAGEESAVSDADQSHSAGDVGDESSTPSGTEEAHATSSDSSGSTVGGNDAPESVLSAGDSTPESSSVVENGEVAAALADEIRQGTVDDDDLATLSQKLDLGTEQSVTVQVEQLQSQMANLQAYTSALEEFLNEEGTAQQVFSELRTDVDRMSSDVADLRARIDVADSNRQEVADVAEQARSRVRSVDDRLADVSSSVDDNADDVANLQAEMRDVTDEVGSLETELGEARTEIGDLEGTVQTTEDRLEDKIESVVSELEDEIESAVDDLEQELETVDSDLGDVDESLEAIRDRVDGLDEFRDSLSGALGD